MKIVLAVTAVVLAVAFACAPEFPVAVFTFAKHPDFPRTAYLDGKLGVIAPTYARSYLVIAYRHLNGIGFDRAEREQVLGYWADRGTGTWDKLDTNWQDHWTTARSRVKGVVAPKPNRLT